MYSSLLNPLSCPVCLVDSFVHLGPMLSWPAFLHHLLDYTLECSDAITALSVARQSIVARECIATEARIWLGTGVDLGVSLQVVAADKTLVAVIASELSIAEMGLHMGLDILFPSKFLVAFFILANPLIVNRIWSLDKLGNVIQRDVGLLDRGVHSRLEMQIRD